MAEVQILSESAKFETWPDATKRLAHRVYHFSTSVTRGKISGLKARDDGVNVVLKSAIW